MTSSKREKREGSAVRGVLGGALCDWPQHMPLRGCHCLLTRATAAWHPKCHSTCVRAPFRLPAVRIHAVAVDSFLGCSSLIGSLVALSLQGCCYTFEQSCTTAH